MRPTVGILSNLAPFTKSWLWDLVIVDTPALVDIDPGVPLRCTSSNIPTKTNEEISQNIRGSIIRDSGQTQVNGELTLNFVLTQDGAIERWVASMANGARNFKTNVEAPRQLLSFSVLLLRLNESQIPIYYYRIPDLLYKSWDPSGLDSENGHSTASITFSFNDFDEGFGAG